MEQVFRIEIPVEVKSNADLGKMKQIEAVLKQAEQEARKLASSADSALSKISSGASSAASSMQQVDSAAKQSADALEDIGDSADKAGDAAEDAADSMEEIGDAAKEAGSAADDALSDAASSADKFSQRMEKSSKTLRDAFKEKLKLTMEAIDRVSPIVKEVTAKVKSLAAKAWKVTLKAVDLVTAPFKALKNMIMSPITMTLSIAGIGLGASSFYQTFTEFEAGMSNVKALSGATNEEFIKLKETASELGATTKFTAAEASEGMQYLAMAGWKTSDIIAGMPGLLQLAAAGGTDLGTAADIVSDVMTAMGMSADQATRAADIFARTATSTNTTIGMMGETLKYAAPVAHSFGLELSEVAAVTGMMANAGIKGGSAGTAIRTALLRMASPSKEASKAMKALGLTFSDSSGKMKDMKTIMKDLGGAFDKLSEQEKLAYADDIFGKNAASAWLSVIEQGESAFNDLYEAIDKSEGAAQEMANTQMDNLTGDVTLLQSAVDGMKVSLMDKLNPYLREGVQWLTSKIPEITTALGNFIDAGISKAKQLKETISGVFNSAEFQNADSIADKLFIAWDKIIAEPFNEWWSGSGRAFVLGIVKKVGTTFGEVLHGIITGVFAALKGEEIDFEGLNLTGIAKAGAEAAKEYVSSFAQGLNASDLMGSMPGWMTAGLVGFGALKIGSGALGIAKTVGQLRLAFGGVTTAAAAATTATAATGEAVTAAAATATTGASAFGGLGSALAAIPGWGWAALAALVAVGIGYKLYKDEQARQEEELLHMGDKVEAAGDRYVKAVQRVHDLDTTLEGIQEIKLRIGEDKEQNDEVIAKVKGEIDSLLHPEIVLTATLQRGGYDTEEAQEILDQVHSAAKKRAVLIASLLDHGYSQEDAENIEQQIADAKFNIATLKAKLASGEYSEEEAAAIEEQIKAAESNLALLYASLIDHGYSTEDAQAIIDQIDEAESNLAMLTTALVNLGYDEEEVKTIIDQIKAIESKNVTLTATLEASGYNVLQAGAIVAEFNAVKEAEKNVALNLTTNTDMTPENIASLTSNLTELMALKESKEIKLSGYGMSAAQITLLQKKASSLKEKMSSIEVAVSEGEGTPEMMQKYANYKAELAVIDLQLQGSEMSADEYKKMTDQVNGIKELISQCIVNLQLDEGSDFTQEEIDELVALLATAGDYYWTLGVNLATGSVTAEDLEGYNAQLEAYAKHLEEISGGMISAEEVMSGEISDKTQDKIDRLQHAEELDREAAYWGLRADVAESRNTRDEVVARRDAAQADVIAATDRVEAMKDITTNLQELRSAGASFEEENRAAKAEYIAEHGELDEGYWADYDKRLADFGEMYGEQISAVGGMFDNLGYEGIFTSWNDIERMDEGPTGDLFGEYIDSLAAVYSEALKNQSEAETKRDEWNDNLVKQYEGERNLATWDITKGTAYEDMNIEQMAAAFSTMDASGFEVFAEAVSALRDLNANTDYISDAEKTTPEALAQTAYESVTAEANQTMLDGMLKGMQEIESAYKLAKSNDAIVNAENPEANANTAGAYAAEQIANINAALASLGSDVQIDSLENIQQAFDALKEVDLENVNFEEAFGDVATIATDVEGLGEKVADAKTKIEELTGVDVSTLTFNTPADSVQDLSNKASTAAANTNKAKSALEALDGTTADTYINEHHTVTTPGHATGGIFSSAHVGLVAEDGPEAIIPLSGKRRERGLSLWMEAGRMLGVGAYAEGGILGPYADTFASIPESAWDDDGNGSGDPKPMLTGGGNGEVGGVTVEVNVNPEYTIEGGNGDPDAILEILRAKQDELAELLGGAMANQLADLLSNMT